MTHFHIDKDAQATHYVSLSTTVSALVFRMEIHSRSKIKIIFLRRWHTMVTAVASLDKSGKKQFEIGITADFFILKLAVPVTAQKQSDRMSHGQKKKH